tara:strand:+ start:5157 stop:5936 length:780 start_codon:yes stop_codon:yes gene_type:complete
MTKKILLSITLLLFCQLTTAAVCKDDPRMYTIKSVIEQMAAGETTAPLKLTPYTFLSLNDNVREALGDNIMVYDENCVPYQVYKQQPPKKIMADFEELSIFMLHAAIRADKKAIDMVVNSFRAAPKSTDELMVLIATLSWPRQAMTALYDYGLFSKMVQNNLHNDSTQTACSQLTAALSMLDLYSLLGGRVSDSIKTLYSIDRDKLYVWTANNVRGSNMELSDVAKTKYDKTSCSVLSFERVRYSLVQAGVNLVDYVKP